MKDFIEIAPEESERSAGVPRGARSGYETVESLAEHSFPGKDRERLTTGDTELHRGSQNPHPVAEDATRVGHPLGSGLCEMRGPSEDPLSDPERSWEEERERRIYRGRTVKMLRRYMRYSIETGRLPSLLGREFFRAPVTPYNMVTFEDRVIFVHDMETCLNKLDDFSRELIGRHILQEHDQEATARLLHCTSRTVRTYVPMALDLLSEILLEVRLMEGAFPIGKKSCQGGKTGEIFVSGSEESKNKF
jgi:hypothetical protein